MKNWRYVKINYRRCSHKHEHHLHIFILLLCIHVYRYLFYFTRFLIIIECVFTGACEMINRQWNRDPLGIKGKACDPESWSGLRCKRQTCSWSDTAQVITYSRTLEFSFPWKRNLQCDFPENEVLYKYTTWYTLTHSLMTEHWMHILFLIMQGLSADKITDWNERFKTARKTCTHTHTLTCTVKWQSNCFAVLNIRCKWKEKIYHDSNVVW